MDEKLTITEEAGPLTPLRPALSSEKERLWTAIVRAGVKARQLVNGGVVVGGTASALYAGHRISFATDHLLLTLKEHFDEVLETLSEAPEWKTTRMKRPVLILGSINNVAVGFRQTRRSAQIETVQMQTADGALTLPTLPELMGMKAYLAYSRNATRDYLDFAALSQCATEDEVLQALLRLDEQYGALQTASVRLEVAKALAAADPYDLSDTDLTKYKALATEWRDWQKTAALCRHFGLLLGQKIVGVA